MVSYSSQNNHDAINLNAVPSAALEVWCPYFLSPNGPVTVIDSVMLSGTTATAVAAEIMKFERYAPKLPFCSGCSKTTRKKVGELKEENKGLKNLVDSYANDLVARSIEQSKTTTELQKQYERLLVEPLSLFFGFSLLTPLLPLILTHAVSLTGSQSPLTGSQSLLTPAHNHAVSLTGPDLSLSDSISRSQSQSHTLRLKLTVTAAITLTDLPSQTHGLTVALSLSIHCSRTSKLQALFLKKLSQSVSLFTAHGTFRRVVVVASLYLVEMDSNSAPSTTGSSVRGKCDPAWSHVLEEVKDGKSSFKCLYCGKVLT
uniref:Uncharacterized protein n=1 Tax=Fagus sylvatica TaxID=28930 RepID=A0A2N9HKB8_FAGSY